VTARPPVIVRTCRDLRRDSSAPRNTPLQNRPGERPRRNLNR
jgi:hypothetical protein